jgi:hypothetical protein
MSLKADYTKLLSEGYTESKAPLLEAFLNAVFTKKHKLDIQSYLPVLQSLLTVSEVSTQKLLLDIFYAIAVTMPKSLEKNVFSLKETIQSISKDDLK